MAKSKVSSKVSSKKTTKVAKPKVISKGGSLKMTKKVAPKTKIAPKKTTSKVKPAKVISKSSPLLKAASKVIKVLKGKDSKLKATKKEPIKKIIEKTKPIDLKAKKIAEEKAKKEAKKRAEEEKKLQAKAKIEAEKQKKAAEKEKSKAKGKKGSFESSEEDAQVAVKNDDDDDFEEEIKKSLKKAPKSGKKAYEEEVTVDHAGFKKYSKDDLETKIADEISSLRELFSWKDIADAIGTLDFFNSEKSDECIEKGCDNIKTTQAYCRLHYLKNWKSSQKKKEILKEGRLQEYIEELIGKYPPKFIEALIGDLSDDKEFYRVLGELNISTEFDFDEEDLEAVDDNDGDDDLGIEARFTGSMRYEDDT
jgi:hypothetical protein